jgi:hypothetical protein
MRSKVFVNMTFQLPQSADVVIEYSNLESSACKVLGNDTALHASTENSYFHTVIVHKSHEKSMEKHDR